MVAAGHEQRARLSFNGKISEGDVIQRKRVVLGLDGCANAATAKLRQVEDLFVDFFGSQPERLVNALASRSNHRKANVRPLTEILNFEVRLVPQRRGWHGADFKCRNADVIGRLEDRNALHKGSGVVKR